MVAVEWADMAVVEEQAVIVLLQLAFLQLLMELLSVVEVLQQVTLEEVLLVVTKEVELVMEVTHLH